MNTENALIEPSETIENNDLGMEPEKKAEIPETENKPKVPEKTVENYSYRGGNAYVGHSQALKLTGSNRATLHRYTQSGKLSYETNEEGHKIYQVVELERVFGKLKTMETNDNVSTEEEREQTETQKPNHETTLKIALLEQENRFLKEQNETLQQNAEDLRQAMRMLTYQPTPAPEATVQPEPSIQQPQNAKGFFGRLFGGSNR